MCVLISTLQFQSFQFILAMEKHFSYMACFQREKSAGVFIKYVLYCLFNEGVVFFLKRLIRNYSQLVLLALSEVWLEDLNGVYRQPSKKPVIFYRPSKIQSNINRQNQDKTFQGISNLTISTKFWPLKNLFTWKTTGHVVKNTHTLSFSLSEHYKTLQLKIFAKCICT